MTSMIQRAVLCAALVSLGACSLAPGPYLDHDQLSDDIGAKTNNTVYPVKLITADVVMAQKRDQAALYAQSAALGKSLNTPVARYDYHVQPPDVLSITVYGHPELASPVAPTMPPPDGGSLALPASGNDNGAPLAQGARVAPDGTIFFPTLGRVPVAGKTTEQIAAELTRALAPNSRRPQVDVVVSRYLSQQMQVTGELKNPGTLPITDAPLTLVNAIARSGGSLPSADLRRVNLTRDGHTTVLDADAVYDRGDMAQNVVLQSGDIVNVPDRGDNRIFVIGEALKPAALPMSKWRLTLADAITGVGSIDPRSADPRQIYVVRGAKENPTQPTVYRLDMTQVDSILLATQFELRPLDVVYIGTASAARFNRVLEQFLPSLQAIFYTVQLGR